MKSLKNLIALCALTLSALTLQAAELTAQDYNEIEQLYAKYNHAIDSGNGAGWAETFTVDGVFNRTTTGRDALATFVKNFNDRSGGAWRHWNSNLVLTGTAEGADGGVYLALWNVGVRPHAIVSTGIYEDKLVKTKDGWRFKSRTVKPDPAPKPAAAPAPASVPPTPAK